MRVWTLKELFCLTRAELFDLHRRIAAELPQPPEASGKREIALANLRLIRRVLGNPKPRLAPG